MPGSNGDVRIVHAGATYPSCHSARRSSRLPWLCLLGARAANTANRTNRGGRSHVGANEGVEPAASVAGGDQLNQSDQSPWASAASEVGHPQLGRSPAMLRPEPGAHSDSHASNDAVNLDTDADADADAVRELRKVLPHLSPALIRRVVMRSAQAHDDAADDQPVDEPEADSGADRCADSGGDSGGEAAEADVDLTDRIPHSRSCEDWWTGEHGPPWAHDGHGGPPWARGGPPWARDRVHPLVQALSQAFEAAWR